MQLNTKPTFQSTMTYPHNMNDAESSDEDNVDIQDLLRRQRESRQEALDRMSNMKNNIESRQTGSYPSHSSNQPYGNYQPEKYVQQINNLKNPNNTSAQGNSHDNNQLTVNKPQMINTTSYDQSNVSNHMEAIYSFPTQYQQKTSTASNFKEGVSRSQSHSFSDTNSSAPNSFSTTSRELSRENSGYSSSTFSPGGALNGAGHVNMHSLSRESSNHSMNNSSSNSNTILSTTRKTLQRQQLSREDSGNGDHWMPNSTTATGSNIGRKLSNPNMQFSPNNSNNNFGTLSPRFNGAQKVPQRIPSNSAMTASPQPQSPVPGLQQHINANNGKVRTLQRVVSAGPPPPDNQLAPQQLECEPMLQRPSAIHSGIAPHQPPQVPQQQQAFSSHSDPAPMGHKYSHHRHARHIPSTHEQTSTIEHDIQKLVDIGMSRDEATLVVNEHAKVLAASISGGGAVGSGGGGYSAPTADVVDLRRTTSGGSDASNGLAAVRGNGNNGTSNSGVLNGSVLQQQAALYNQQQQQPLQQQQQQPLQQQQQQPLQLQLPQPPRRQETSFADENGGYGGSIIPPPSSARADHQHRHRDRHERGHRNSSHRNSTTDGEHYQPRVLPDGTIESREQRHARHERKREERRSRRTMAAASNSGHRNGGGGSGSRSPYHSRSKSPHRQRAQPGQTPVESLDFGGLSLSQSYGHSNHHGQQQQQQQPQSQWYPGNGQTHQSSNQSNTMPQIQDNRRGFDQHNSDNQHEFSQSVNNTPRTHYRNLVASDLNPAAPLTDRDLINISMNSYGVSENEWDSGSSRSFSNNSSFYSTASANQTASANRKLLKANTLHNTSLNSIFSIQSVPNNNNHSSTGRNGNVSGTISPVGGGMRGGYNVSGMSPPPAGNHHPTLSPRREQAKQQPPSQHSPIPSSRGASVVPSNNNEQPQQQPAQQQQVQQPQAQEGQRAADAKALQLGLLLSKQEQCYGINMCDEIFLKANEFELNAMVSQGGYKHEHAAQIVFERLYGVC